LWKWMPDKSGVKKRGSSDPQVVRQVPVQIGMSFAPRGALLGFRRDDGQLIALAGATTQPLAEAHYTWQTLAGETQHMGDVDDSRPIESDASKDAGSSVLDLIFDFVGDVIFKTDVDDDGGYDHRSGKGREHHSHDHSDKSHSSDEPKKKPASQPWQQ
jgi:hypothetical protein